MDLEIKQKTDYLGNQERPSSRFLKQQNFGSKIKDKRQSSCDQEGANNSQTKTNEHSTIGKSHQRIEKIPHPFEFSNCQYENLLKNFDLNSSNLILLQENNTSLVKSDLWKLENDEIVTNNTVVMFANYLNLLQTEYTDLYNKNNLNRCFVAVLEIKQFDKAQQKASYAFLSSIEKTQRLLSNFDKLIFIVQYDERWTCVVLDLSEGKLSMADFLSKGLSGMKSDDILKRVKIVIKSEFPSIEIQHKSVYKLSQLNFLSDCGIYIMSFVYKCINNSILDNMQVNFWEKDLFRKQLVWLFLKLALRKTENQTSFFSKFQSSSMPKISLLSNIDEIPTSLTKYTEIIPDKRENKLLPKSLKTQRESNLADLSYLDSKDRAPKIIKTTPKSRSYAPSLMMISQEESERSCLQNQIKENNKFQSAIDSITFLTPKSVTRKTETRRRVVESLNDLDDKFEEILRKQTPKQSKIQKNSNIFSNFDSQTFSSSQSTKNYNSSNLFLPPLKEASLCHTRLNNMKSKKMTQSKVLSLNNSNFKSLQPSRGDFDWKNPSQPKIEEDDCETNSSPSVILYGFQEGNSRPKRINIRFLEERHRRHENLENLSQAEEDLKKSLKSPKNKKNDFYNLFNYERGLMNSTLYKQNLLKFASISSDHHS